MEPLDKETFSFWVTHPDELLPSDFGLLQEAIEQYPYCQALYTLGAKAASVHQKSHAIGWVRQAAAHALSRNALRRLIENEFQWSPNLLSKLNELSLKHVPVPDDYQRESYALFREKAAQNRVFPSLPFFDFTKPPLTTPPDDQLAEPLPTERAETLAIVDESTQTEGTLRTDLDHQSLPDSEEVDQLRQQQLEIIEKFIRNEPQISRVRLQSDTESKQEDLASRGIREVAAGGLVTESFAQILVRQGKLDKAIDIYQKLMVKNPEKKRYFAEKIDGLKAR